MIYRERERQIDRFRDRERASGGQHQVIQEKKRKKKKRINNKPLLNLQFTAPTNCAITVGTAKDRFPIPCSFNTSPVTPKATSHCLKLRHLAMVVVVPH